MAELGYRLARPFLNLVTPEAGHRLAIRALKAGLIRVPVQRDDPVLATRVCGIDFPNPVGLAAGFDKDAEVCDAMLACGFGFVEAGTVTPVPQPGNPKPRLFRLEEDEGVINRLGFNSGGVRRFAERLHQRRAKNLPGIVGANVGKNRDTKDGAADYAIGIEAVCGLADYLVCNISSPNTPGLRDLQRREPIEDLLRRVLAARSRTAPDPKNLPPLFAKVGPDLDSAQIEDIAEVALATGVDGLIIGNTTIERPAGLASRDAPESGGLSGKPLTGIANRCLAEMYRRTGGKLPIVGCGGIASGAQAYERIRSGASLVQLYSALVFHGPGLARRINTELAQLLRRDGFKSVTEAVGADQR